MDSVEELPGLDGELPAFYYQQFQLHWNGKKSSRKNVIAHLECMHIRAGVACPFKLLVMGDAESVDAEYNISGQHNHEILDGAFERERFRRLLEQSVLRHPTESISLLYDDLLEELKYDLEKVDAKKYLCASISRKMKNWFANKPEEVSNHQNCPVKIPVCRSLTFEKKLDCPSDDDAAAASNVEDSGERLLPDDQLGILYQNSNSHGRLRLWSDHLAQQRHKIAQELEKLAAEKKLLRQRLGPEFAQLNLSSTVAELQNQLPKEGYELDSKRHSNFEQPPPLEAEQPKIQPRQCMHCKIQPACVFLIGCGKICLCGLCAMVIENTTKKCPCCGKAGQFDSSGSMIYQVVF